MSLVASIRDRIKDHLPLNELSCQFNQCLIRDELPSGGFGSPSILSSLHSALNLEGYLSRVHEAYECDSRHGWILGFPEVPFPKS